QHGENQLEHRTRRRLEAVAVQVVLGGDVAREGVEAVRPPEAGALVRIEGQYLLGQRLAVPRRDGEVAVEDIVDLGPVFEEEAGAEAPVADAVADHQVVGAVDCQPAIATVPDRCADDGAAAHGVAAQVIVKTVLAEDSLLAEMTELSVADRAGGAAVI